MSSFFSTTSNSYSEEWVNEWMNEERRTNNVLSVCSNTDFLMRPWVRLRPWIVKTYMLTLTFLRNVFIVNYFSYYLNWKLRSGIIMLSQPNIYDKPLEQNGNKNGSTCVLSHRATWSLLDYIQLVHMKLLYPLYAL